MDWVNWNQIDFLFLIIAFFAIKEAILALSTAFFLKNTIRT